MSDEYPYIFKREGRFYLAVGRNIYASPCRCDVAKGTHFHYNRGIRNENITLKVEEGKDYPEM